jgi:hypothetical protein
MKTQKQTSSRQQRKIVRASAPNGNPTKNIPWAIRGKKPRVSSGQEKPVRLQRVDPTARLRIPSMPTELWGHTMKEKQKGVATSK